MLLGGEPFEEEIVMWWNFIGRSHEEIVDAARGLERRRARRPARRGSGRWPDFDGDRLLAPPMPTTRLQARGRAG